MRGNTNLASRALWIGLLIGWIAAGTVAGADEPATATATKEAGAKGTATQATGATKENHAKPGDSLGIASIKNLRDVGGYPTKDGFVVKTGVLYRSNELNRISAADKKKIEALSLKSDYDLRRVDEKDSAPDELPEGVKYIWINVMADSKLGPTPSVGRLIANPRQANTDYGSGKMEARFLEGYQCFVSLPSAQASYKRMFTDLQDEKNLPAIVHCTSGKDRTGWAVAALYALLGVPEEVIFADYLKSNDNLLPGYQSMMDSFGRNGGEKTILPAILGVQPEYLKSAFEEVRTKYGTIEAYFATGLEIDAAGQQALKDRFLTKP